MFFYIMNIRLINEQAYNEHMRHLYQIFLDIDFWEFATFSTAIIIAMIKRHMGIILIMMKKSQDVARTLSHSKLSVSNIFYLKIMVKILDPNDNTDFNLQTSIMLR